MFLKKNFIWQLNIFLLVVSVVLSIHFEPTWKSLDQHVAPAWYDEAKIGIFMHWGLYSVPSFGLSDAGSEWFWQRWQCEHEPHAVKYMHDNYAPNFKYQDFAPLWNAEFFNASEWADLIKESGARYYILTSKHHEGFTLWQSNASWNWNAVDSGPHRDIIAELAAEIRSRTDVHFGLYFSLFEWFHPLYLLDKQNNFTTKEYVKNVAWPQLFDLVHRYKPEYIWSDGDAGPQDYWMSKEFLAWLYNDSPVKDSILVNDRWGKGTACLHGDVKNCADRYSPSKILIFEGSKVNFKWEDAMTLDKHSWGYRRQMNANDVYDIHSLIALLSQVVSTGGNLLINVGPTSDGKIAPIFQERLKQFGSWLKVNGEAIYSTRPWRIQNDTAEKTIWYTKKSTYVNAILLEWPDSGQVTLQHPVPTADTFVTMHGLSNKLDWYGKVGKPGLQIDVSEIKPPCDWAWSFTLYNVM